MERKIMFDIKKWYDKNDRKCLLIDGARQVGKTYIVREFAKRYCESFLEINLLTDTRAKDLLSRASSTKEIFAYLDAIYHSRLIPGKTLIFFDEVQECLDLITASKFLVEDGRFRYILSGSLLGIEMSDVKSVPVGYMQIMQMYPLNFAEFCSALGMGQDAFDYLEECFNSLETVNEAIHSRIMSNYRNYLLVGGMPEAVNRFLETESLPEIKDVHEFLYNTYKKDISKYDKKDKLMISRIFDNIPSELNKQNKRYRFSSLDQPKMTQYVENSFLWLINAGVALPVYNVDAPQIPLKMNRSNSLLKLFMCDVGLLNYMYFDDELVFKTLTDTKGINFGAIYENFVAQELYSNSIVPYYYNSHTYGELDLLYQTGGEIIPLEVKSGKDYQRHNALNGILNISHYQINKAYVLNNYPKIEKIDKRIYLPIYMAMFLRREMPEDTKLECDKSPWDVPSSRKE
ncbi:MAG: AAA family ATPase [Clostridia bacterium]|nr:AAA family ATPase [Clostridia bacterium]